MGKVVDYDAWQKLQLAPLTDFNPAVLQGLKYSQHSGYLLELERLYSTMYLEWPTLKKDASDMTEAVAGLTWTVAPFCQDGAEPDDEAKAVAKTVSDALWMVSAQKPGEFSHCFPELLGAMVHAIYRSVNVHEIVWKFTPELVYPLEYKQLGPQYYMWETRQGEPDRLMLVPDGMDYTRPMAFEPGRFVVALNTTGPDHPMYNADFYSLVGYFVAAKFGLPGLQSFVKRYGHPLRKFTIENKTRRQELEAKLRSMPDVYDVFLGPGESLDVTAIPAGANVPHEVLLRVAENACHQLIKGNTLTSDVGDSGGSRAQAEVHMGVEASLVRKRGEFVARVLNRQLIPYIVQRNYGRMDLPMPELRCQVPEQKANIQKAQYWQAVLGIPGMRVLKSAVHDDLGLAVPGDGDDVYEGASATPTPTQGGEGAPDAATPTQGVPEVPSMGDDALDVTMAARSDGGGSLRERVERMLPEAMRRWAGPTIERFEQMVRDGRKPEEILARLEELRPDSRPLVDALRAVTAAGLGLPVDGGEDAAAANPYGCNQYGHGWSGECGGGSGGSSADDEDDYPDVDWDEYDFEQEIKRLVHNRRDAELKRRRRAVGSALTDSLKKWARTTKQLREGYLKPADRERLQREEMNAWNEHGKAVHEWRRFHRARLKAEGWTDEQAERWMSSWPEVEQRVEAANPYGCNQYGHGWSGECGGGSGGSSADDEDDYPDVDWDEYDFEQEIKRLVHNRRDAELKRRRRAVGSALTDSLKKWARTTKQLREGYLKPADRERLQREEMNAWNEHGKAVHEWRRFHRARLKAEGWTDEQAERWMSSWPEVEQRVEAANPYGCNQYGEGWSSAHDGNSTERVGKAKLLTHKDGDGNVRQIDTKKRYPGKGSYIGVGKDEPKPEPKPEPKKKEKPEKKPESKEEEKKAPEPKVNKPGHAESREEAIEHTRQLLSEKHREHGDVSFSDLMTLEHINEFNGTIAKLVERYPVDTLRRLGSYRDSNGNVGAHANSSVLEVNHNAGTTGLFAFRTRWKSFTEAERNWSGGFTRHNVGSTENGITIEAVVIHEYGHVLHKKIHDWADICKERKKYKLDVSEADQRIIDAQNSLNRAYLKAKRNGDIKQVSLYAGKNNLEFFAECFAARELGEKLPDYITKALDKVIECAIKKS